MLPSRWTRRWTVHPCSEIDESSTHCGPFPADSLAITQREIAGAFSVAAHCRCGVLAYGLPGATVGPALARAIIRRCRSSSGAPRSPVHQVTIIDIVSGELALGSTASQPPFRRDGDPSRRAPLHCPHVHAALYKQRGCRLGQHHVRGIASGSRRPFHNAGPRLRRSRDGLPAPAQPWRSRSAFRSSAASMYSRGLIQKILL
jgi:hypothetical protein